MLVIDLAVGLWKPNKLAQTAQTSHWCPWACLAGVQMASQLAGGRDLGRASLHGRIVPWFAHHVQRLASVRTLCTSAWPGSPTWQQITCALMPQQMASSPTMKLVHRTSLLHTACVTDEAYASPCQVRWCVYKSHNTDMLLYFVSLQRVYARRMHHVCVVRQLQQLLFNTAIANPQRLVMAAGNRYPTS